MNRETYQNHVTILGALHVGYHLVGILIAFVVFGTLVGSGIASRDPDAMAILSVIGTFVCLFLFVVSVPGLVAGVGLLRRAPWARVLALVVGAANLLNIPIGTALGIYTIYVLAQDPRGPIQPVDREAQPATPPPPAEPAPRPGPPPSPED